ncbi:hypothetical protein BGX38DRAFT_1279720 [Terfezia claveryi]|nr:hypothetical protein BGX38DRAFT_1279720 [Terfezia claveryi]
MGTKKRKLIEASDGGDPARESSGDEDYGTKQFADALGFNDPGVPKTLYQIWRNCMQRAITEFGVYGPGESGHDRFAWFCEWGVAHPAMAPRGQINYHDEAMQVMWEAIADARAAFEAANPDIVVEPVDQLPDMGAPRADPAYMPGNQGSVKARTASTAERQRAAARIARPDATPVREAAPARPLLVPVIIPLAVPGKCSLTKRPPRKRLPLKRLPLPKLQQTPTDWAQGPDSGAPVGVAGGPLAVAVCRQPHSAEQHGPDPLYGGWVFTSATISAIVVLGLYSITAIEAAAAPYIPPGRVMQFLYSLDMAGRFMHIGIDYVLGAALMGHQGPHLLDFLLELAPMSTPHTLAPPRTLGAVELAATLKSIVPKLKDGLVAKGTKAGKSGKTGKGGTPAFEVATPAKKPKVAKRPMPATENPAPAKERKRTTTSPSAAKRVKGPTATSGKPHQGGQATKDAQGAHDTKVKKTAAKDAQGAHDPEGGNTSADDMGADTPANDDSEARDDQSMDELIDDEDDLAEEQDYGADNNDGEDDEEVYYIPVQSPSQGVYPRSSTLLHFKIFSIRNIPRKGKHNKSKDNKGKGKEIATLKRQASTHDLREVARTVDKTGGSSKFSAVIKFSAGSSSSRNTPQDFVDHPEVATETDTSPTTQKKISREVLARQDVGADNSGMVLENIPSESAVGSQKEGGSCTTGTVQVSGKDLDRSNASSERTSVSKANIEVAKPRLLESIMINSYPRNAQEHTSVLVGSSVVGIQKGEKISRRNRSITQFCGVLRDMVETAGNSNASRSFIKKHVTELMKRDRYTCAASHRKTWGYRFRAEEEVELIHQQYFNGKRKLGHVDPRFLKSINGPFLCLVFAALYNALGAWESGECGMESNLAISIRWNKEGSKEEEDEGSMTGRTYGEGEKENEEPSDSEDMEEDQEYTQRDLEYKHRMEKVAERLRDWDVDEGRL